MGNTKWPDQPCQSKQRWDFPKCDRVQILSPQVWPTQFKVVKNVFPLNILIKNPPYTVIQRIAGFSSSPTNSRLLSFLPRQSNSTAKPMKPQLPSRRSLKAVLIIVWCRPIFPGCFASSDITFKGYLQSGDGDKTLLKDGWCRAYGRVGGTAALLQQSCGEDEK